jgi:hypothetical protein
MPAGDAAYPEIHSHALYLPFFAAAGVVFFHLHNLAYPIIVQCSYSPPADLVMRSTTGLFSSRPRLMLL